MSAIQEDNLEKALRDGNICSGFLYKAGGSASGAASGQYVVYNRDSFSSKERVFVGF